MKEITLINLARQPDTVRTISQVRRETDWTKVSNENLKFALDVLELHHNPVAADVLFEIQRRVAAGRWLDIENPPPPLHNLPFFLTIWPFSLLWRQRPR